MSGKWAKRLRIVGLNAVLQMLPALSNIAAAWWVVHFGSETIWGLFVDPLILAGLALHVLAWGNKEFLLRAFAMRPDAIPVLWKQALIARGTLLFMMIPLIFLSNWNTEQMVWFLVWIVFGYLRHSFDVIVVYQKDFLRGVLVELAALSVLFGGLFLSMDALDLTVLIRYFALAQVVRALLFGAIYGNAYLSGPFPQMQFRYFSTAFPFFLLGFAGMLVTRTDLLFVAYWLDDAAAGRYQILINLFTYIQAGAGFVVYPFARNIYRMPDKTIRKIAIKVTLAGLGALAVGIPIAWILLEEAFKIPLSWEYYALGAAASFPVFAYFCFVLLLYKHGQQKQVLLANLGGVLINLGLNLVLTPRIGPLGALWGSVACQWFILFMLVLYTGRRKD